MKIVVEVAKHIHINCAEKISKAICEAAEKEGSGIARRTPEYFASKINEGKAVIAFVDEKLAGFCYIEVWDHEEFVGNAGLIVLPEYQNNGIAKKLKRKLFELSRNKYPKAKLFGITTSMAVMKINTGLGYRPVTYSELTKSDDYWYGCRTCSNYEILQKNNREKCLCTALLYDPLND